MHVQPYIHKYVYIYSYYNIIYIHSSIYPVNYVTQSLVLRPFFDQMQPETQWCSEAQVYHLSWSMFHAVCCWKKCISYIYMIYLMIIVIIMIIYNSHVADFKSNEKSLDNSTNHPHEPRKVFTCLPLDTSLDPATLVFAQTHMPWSVCRIRIREMCLWFLLCLSTLPQTSVFIFSSFTK